MRDRSGLKRPPRWSASLSLGIADSHPHTLSLCGTALFFESVDDEGSEVAAYDGKAATDDPPVNAEMASVCRKGQTKDTDD